MKKVIAKWVLIALHFQIICPALLVAAVPENENNETIAIIARRADQIGIDLKEELNRKLEEFASYTDNLEEIFENREQIEISKFYERLPKPTLIAMEEFLEGNVYFRGPDSIVME